MTRSEFMGVMAYLQLGSGSSKPITEQQAEVYWDFLKDVPFDVAKVSAKRSLAESQYPTLPPVGVLLKNAGVDSGALQPESRALLAYSIAASAVRHHGEYESVDFEDRLINATIRNMGGWSRFCCWPSDELQWRQRDFERHYQALLQSGVSGDLAAPLVGIHETSNSSLGYVTSDIKRIHCDLPPHRPNLIRGYVPVRRIAIEESVEHLAKSFSIDSPPNPPQHVLTEQEFADRKTQGIARIREWSSTREVPQ